MGKPEKLLNLQGKNGLFLLMAIDQRQSLKKMLAKPLSSDADKINGEHLTRVKQIIIKILSPHTTGVLVDPTYGYPIISKSLKKGLGFLMATEESGGATRTKLSGWTPNKINRAGASAVKMLLPYSEAADQETKLFQQNVARSIGEQCVVAGMPFVLELTSYPETTKESVLAAVTEFSKPEYRVDLFKLEYPGSKTACEEVTQIAVKPWIMLSAGVSFDEFYKQMSDAVSGGASGYLVGRAVWQDAITLYDPKDKKLKRMRAWLEKTGVSRLKALRDLCYSFAKEANVKSRD